MIQSAEGLDLSVCELGGSFLKWTLKTHPWARSRVPVYHIRHTPVLVDHVGSAPGRQNRALLPRADPAQMLSSEIEGAVRRIEKRVLALLAITESCGEAEAVRHLAPGNCHWLLELPAPAGMQTLDCRARHVELFAQRSSCYFVRLPADRIAAEQNPLRRKEAIAGTGGEGVTYDPSNSADVPPLGIALTKRRRPTRRDSFDKLEMSADNLKAAVKKVDNSAAAVEVALKRLMPA